MSFSAIIASSRVREIILFVNAINDLTVTANTDTTAELTFTMPSSSSTIDYYKVYVDGVLHTTTEDDSIPVTITGLTSGTEYDVYINAVDVNGLEGGDGNEVELFTGMSLSYASTTSLDLRIQTVSGQNWEVDWGDGTWVSYTSSTTIRTKTFGVATSGVVKLRSAVGNSISDINYIYSAEGSWNFNISALSNVTYYVRFNGSSMALTGDISALSNVTYYVYFNGNSMTLTGDISALSNVTYYVLFNGNSMTLTYSTTTWATLPSNSFALRLATGRLTATEVDNLFIDLNATGASGSATIDFRGSNAAPTATSLAARTALASRGYTVLTN